MNAAIVSAAPFDLIETKISLNPSYYFVPQAEEGNVSLLVIRRASYPMYLDENRGNLILWEEADVLAKAIVNESVNNMPMVRLDARPAIFAASDEETVKLAEQMNGSGTFQLPIADVPRSLRPVLRSAEKAQDRWLTSLVSFGDAEYKRSNDISKIWELSKKAASWLHVTRDWMAELSRSTMKKCPLCANDILQAAIFCMYCRNPIDMEGIKKLGLGGDIGIQAPPGTNVLTPTPKLTSKTAEILGTK